MRTNDYSPAYTKFFQYSLFYTPMNQKEHKQKKRLSLWKIMVPVLAFLFLLHCRAWYAEEEMLLRTAFSSGSYLRLNQIIVAIIFPLSMGGWLYYSYKRGVKKGDHWRNLAYGFMWGGAFVGLCTNVFVVLLFWLNGCFTSGVQTRKYVIVGTTVHDRTPKAYKGRSAAMFLNTFPYGEVFVKGDRYTRIYMSVDYAYQFSAARGVYLTVDMEDGWLGWGIIRKIRPVAMSVPDEEVEVRFSGETKQEVADSCAHQKSGRAFKYTWRDIHIFAKLRNIDLSDTTHVSVNRYIDGEKDIPVWEIDVRNSLQPDKARVILIHGESGEVIMDSYE